MQVVSPLSPSPKLVGKDSFPDLYGKLNDEFDSKLKVDFTEKEEEEEDDDDEFSFASVNGENSPITADEAFKDGQIRPYYPLFNQDLLFDYERDESKEESKVLRSPLKKLFVESESTTASTAEASEPMGPYCSWSGRTVEEATPERCRKSYSTGFSKLWRFRDLVLRSNSDGKDAFVFLSNGEKSQSSKLNGVERREKGKTEEKKKMKTKTKSAHERLYMRNRAIKEEGKRRSYLPYKHVGFFTNVNGLTKNVHPF